MLLFSQTVGFKIHFITIRSGLGVRNYLTKFLSDDWMIKKKFIEKPKEKEEVFPKNTFEIKDVYNPEKPSNDRYQNISEPWPQKEFQPFRPMLMNTIDEAIGWTPLVRLSKIPKSLGIEAEICE